MWSGISDHSESNFATWRLEISLWRRGRKARNLRVLLNTPRGVWLGENLGDVAMCRGAVRRLAAFAPRAALAVVVDDPAVLGREAALIESIPSSARDHWLREPKYVGARRFAAALDGADLVATTGHGALVDIIIPESAAHLRIVDAAARKGAVTALLGHGVGPLEDPDLQALAADVLPRLDVICVRERDGALSQLALLGVDRSRVIVTGDDATEMAGFRGRGQEAAACLGLSVRRSGVDSEAASSIACAARQVAARHSLALEPLPIDHSDPATLAELGLSCELPSTIDPVLASARRCRAIVGGSYHACVFALSQGVPAVALTGTDFYRHKIGGLAKWFPSGCEVVDVCLPDLAVRVEAALERALARPEDERRALKASALQQAEAGRAAMRALVSRALAVGALRPSHRAP